MSCVLMIVFHFSFLSFSDSKVKLKPTAVTKTNKKTVETNAIDMVDSGSEAIFCVHQPEQETVISMKTNEQPKPKLNKCNDKQTNIANNSENNVFDNKHRNNCDNLREINATNDDKNGVINGADKMNVGATSEFDGFDDDPYAELQSYLEKVKVSYK